MQQENKHTTFNIGVKEAIDLKNKMALDFIQDNESLTEEHVHIIVCENDKYASQSTCKLIYLAFLPN